MLKTLQPGKSNLVHVDNEKKIATLLTIFLLLFVYFILNIMHVPAKPKKKNDIPAIDILFEKYRPETLFTIPTPRPDLSKITSESILPRPVNPIPQPTVPDLQDQLEELFRPVKSPEMKLDRQFTDDPKRKDILLAQNDLSDLERSMSRSIEDDTDPRNLVRVPIQRNVNAHIEAAQSNTSIRTKRTVYVMDDGDPKRLIEKKESNPIRKIKIMPIQELPKLQTQIPQILRKLSEWMKRNPTPLPDAAKKFMEYNSNDLTSRVEFEIDGRVFEIYLLCIENIYEIKICLIEGRQTTLLKDQGFTQKSHFLRTGTVHRTKNEILAFGTEQKPASKRETQEFYQIFLSWWKSTGMDDK